MTITTNAGFDASAAAAAPGLLYLVELDFLGGTQYLTNWPTDVTVAAQVYSSMALGSVGELKESEDGQTQKVELSLNQVKASYLALALGNVANYQGRSVRICVALTDANLAITGAPVLRFGGWMNVVKIRRSGENQGVITMECNTGGYDVRRNPAALRMNDSQHQVVRPGELGFVYVADLIGKPTAWLSKRFQTV